MGESEDEKEAGAADDTDDEDQKPADFDPKRDVEKMSEKERKAWNKNLAKYRMFINFLLRHVTIANYRFNCFVKEEQTAFMIAMEKVESLRGSMKLKKGEVVRLGSFRQIKEAADLLNNRGLHAESVRLRKMLDLAGRMKGLAMIGLSFYKGLKKGKVVGLEQIKNYLDYWKGFTVRTFDYGELGFRNADPETFNELERKFLIWPTVIKTAIHLAQRFLKATCDSTGLELLPLDAIALQQRHMQPAECLLASRIEDVLLERVTVESSNFLLGIGNPLLIGQPMTAQPAHRKWSLPPMDEIDQKMLQPVADSAVLIRLPEEPPKEKKKKKKKGKKSGRPGSHKGKGKKKKKK